MQSGEVLGGATQQLHVELLGARHASWRQVSEERERESRSWGAENQVAQLLERTPAHRRAIDADDDVQGAYSAAAVGTAAGYLAGNGVRRASVNCSCWHVGARRNGGEEHGRSAASVGGWGLVWDGRLPWSARTRRGCRGAAEKRCRLQRGLVQVGETKEGSEGGALASVDISGGGHGTRTFLRHVALA